jgi:hypothetical protein
LVDDFYPSACAIPQPVTITGIGGHVQRNTQAVPEDWFLPVLMDWSGGFWEQMAKEYPRLSLA